VEKRIFPFPPLVIYLIIYSAVFKAASENKVVQKLKQGQKHIHKGT